jgi:virulence-associated protein VagC
MARTRGDAHMPRCSGPSSPDVDALDEVSTGVDTFDVKSHEDRAKLFQHGGSQAVRLPRQYRFVGAREVGIHREGDRVILEPVRRVWSQRFLNLAGSAPDFSAPHDAVVTDAPPELE